ncbi:MAG: carbamoyltransferase C-terminal domain-containing protein, partial [Candidatus Omnitrophota bacterium]
IPAVTHIDGSARVQTVDRADNPLFYKTIYAFYRKTRCPVVINTSFNVRGEPLVCSPHDALTRFMSTEIDYLVIGNFILDKSLQKK